MAPEILLDPELEIEISSASRRNFLKTALFVLGILTVWPTRLVWAKKVAISLDKVEKLKDAGGSLILKIKDKKVLFIRESQESIRSLDPTCTHNKCQVAYNADKNTIDCPCHGSRYDLEGNVLQGPAPEPLKSFETYIDDRNRIILSLEDE
jgi:Rieske Fe-S protein